MAQNNLKNKKVAILATDGFEEAELVQPRDALSNAGADVRIVAPHDGQIQGWNHDKPAGKVSVDMVLEDAKPDDFDAVVLPGGVRNPDELRTNESAVNFVRKFFEDHKPVAAICHGPWLLVEADVVSGRRLTSWPSLRTDIENAGAEWVDETVVTDQGLVTSRRPADLPAFNSKVIEEIAEGRHVGQHA